MQDLTSAPWIKSSTLTLGIVLTLLQPLSWAQNYPSKPVKIVIP
jgi:hypothetical protein